MSMDKFFKLIQANKDKPRNIPNAYDTEGMSASINVKDNEATIYVYGVIISDEYWQFSDYDVVASQFVKAVRDVEAEVDVLNVRIDSPGGEVFAARSMCSALNDFTGTVNVFVDGLAASSASFLAMSGDNITMAEGSMFMIHNAWCCCCGNSSDLNKSADLLDKLDGTIASTYAKRTGIKDEDLIQMMKDETWITDKEAVEMGFADGIAEGKTVGNVWDTSVYNNVPKQDLPKDKEPVNNEPVTNSSDNEDNDINNEQYAHNQRYATYLESFV